MEELLEKLISFKSVIEDHSANAQALDFIERFVSERGMHIRRFDWNGASSLVATTRQHTKKPTVMLAGHIDVVPAAAIPINILVVVYLI
jgi:acetylornithine deacetylase/succinyl-diaminopimelate desuccinylase-like protein